VVFLVGAVTVPGSAQTAVPNPPVAAYQPLTNQQRWDHYLQDTVLSPGLYFASLGVAAGSQLAHDPPEWRQGFAGYSRRSASAFGVFTIQATVHQGAAAALGYDPRYRRCDCGGFWRRSGHAIKWSFLTRNASGQTRFDVPALAGAYGAGMLPIFWYPHRFNPLTDGVRIGNQEVGFYVGLNVLREFAPEIKQRLHFKH